MQRKKSGTRQPGNLGQHKEIQSTNNRINFFLTWDFAQVKIYRKFCQKIIEENLLNQKKEVPIKVQEVQRTENRLDQKKNPKSKHGT